MPHRNAGQIGFMHDELRCRRERRLRADETEQLGNTLMRASGKRQEANGFRQPPRQDRNQQQRRRTADHKHRTPAELRNQRRREQAAERRADRKPAEHDHHHGGAATMRAELGRHRHRIRHGAAKPETGQKPDREQRGDVLDQGSRQRADAERQRREDDDLLAPDPIRQRPEQQRPDHQPEQAGAEYRAELGLAQAPFPGQRRRDIANGLGVEAVEEQHCRTGQ